MKIWKCRCLQIGRRIFPAAFPYFHISIFPYFHTSIFSPPIPTHRPRCVTAARTPATPRFGFNSDGLKKWLRYRSARRFAPSSRLKAPIPVITAPSVFHATAEQGICKWLLMREAPREALAEPFCKPSEFLPRTTGRHVRAMSIWEYDWSLPIF